MSNKLFQKRKYQKGWYINSTKKINKSTKVDKKEEYVAQNVAKEEEKATAQETVSVVENNTSTLEVNSTATEANSTVEAAEVSTYSNSEADSYDNSNVVVEEASSEVLNNSDVMEDFSAEATPEDQEVISEENSNSGSSLGAEWWLYVLCFFIPWLAVGLVTDWDVKTVVINVLWTLLCGIPGIIHALIVVNREG